MGERRKERVSGGGRGERLLKRNRCRGKKREKENAGERRNKLTKEGE